LGLDGVHLSEWEGGWIEGFGLSDRLDGWMGWVGWIDGSTDQLFGLTD
jgi:hypothetical protein